MFAKLFSLIITYSLATYFFILRIPKWFKWWLSSFRKSLRKNSHRSSSRQQLAYGSRNDLYQNDLVDVDESITKVSAPPTSLTDSSVGTHKYLKIEVTFI